MQLIVQKTRSDAVLPSYTHPGDAGLDLSVVEKTVVKPHETTLVQTGLRIAVPEGHVGLVFERSSFHRRTGLSFANKVGVVDSGYRGNLCMIVGNPLDTPVVLQAGDRIGQLVVVPVPFISVIEAPELPFSERGENGFGSSGN